MLRTDGMESYAQRRLAIRQQVEAVCLRQITRITLSNYGNTITVLQEEQKTRWRFERLGHALRYREMGEVECETRGLGVAGHAKPRRRPDMDEQEARMV